MSGRNLSTFRKKVRPPFSGYRCWSAVKKEAVLKPDSLFTKNLLSSEQKCFLSDMAVNFYPNTRRHVPEDSILTWGCCEWPMGMGGCLGWDLEGSSRLLIWAAVTERVLHDWGKSCKLRITGLLPEIWTWDFRLRKSVGHFTRWFEPVRAPNC